MLLPTIAGSHDFRNTILESMELASKMAYIWL